MIPRRDAGRAFAKPLATAAVALAAACSAYLGGCDGGTSTEAGNPGLTLQISGTPNNQPFRGFIQFFATGTDPSFFTPPPDDGLSSPQIVLGGEKVSTLVLSRGNTLFISRDQLASLINSQPIQPLFKSAGTRAVTPLPGFNIVLMGFDSTSGWLSGIQADTLTGRLRYADSSGGDTLVIDVASGKAYDGALDTAGLESQPLGLFVPGTPFYAPILGDSFHFEDMPSGKLPLRLISKDGWIRKMEDSLGATWPHALKPGDRIDSVSLPVPYPTLEPPAASPSGQYAFTDSVAVSLSAEGGALIFYTLDGSTPGIGSKRYANPLTLRASATLKAIAFMKGHNRSPISVNNYVLVPAAPIATPGSETFHDSLAVSLSSPAKNTEIYFTLDGSEPGADATKYTAPITLTATTTLKAVAILPGLGNSRIIEEKYILVADSAAAY